MASVFQRYEKVKIGPSGEKMGSNGMPKRLATTFSSVMYTLVGTSRKGGIFKTGRVVLLRTFGITEAYMVYCIIVFWIAQVNFASGAIWMKALLECNKLLVSLLLDFE
jgi:hypothetical protein